MLSKTAASQKEFEITQLGFLIDTSSDVHNVATA